MVRAAPAAARVSRLAPAGAGFQGWAGARQAGHRLVRTELPVSQWLASPAWLASAKIGVAGRRAPWSKWGSELPTNRSGASASRSAPEMRLAVSWAERFLTDA